MRETSLRRTKGFLLRRILVALIGVLFFLGLAAVDYSSAETDENQPKSIPETPTSDTVPPVSIITVEPAAPAIKGPAVQIKTGNGEMVLLHDRVQGSIQIDPDTELLVRPYLYKDGHILMEIRPKGLFENNEPVTKMVSSGKTIALVGLVRNSKGNPAVIFLTPKIVTEDEHLDSGLLTSLSRNGYFE